MHSLLGGFCNCSQVKSRLSRFCFSSLQKGNLSGGLLGLIDRSLLEGLDQVGDLIITLGSKGSLAGSGLLVGLSELAERGKGVGAELVQDTGDELGQLLLLTAAVDGVGVGGSRNVNYFMFLFLCRNKRWLVQLDYRTRYCSHL